MATIKRGTMLIFCERLTRTRNDIISIGDTVAIFRYNDMWITKAGGQFYKVPGKEIRGEKHYKIIEQYSINDIVYSLQSKNDNYYTVYWEMLKNAIDTALKEADDLKSIDDLYKYISTNLI